MTAYLSNEKHDCILRLYEYILFFYHKNASSFMINVLGDEPDFP